MRIAKYHSLLASLAAPRVSPKLGNSLARAPCTAYHPARRRSQLIFTLYYCPSRSLSGFPSYVNHKRSIEVLKLGRFHLGWVRFSVRLGSQGILRYTVTNSSNKWEMRRGTGMPDQKFLELPLYSFWASYNWYGILLASNPADFICQHHVVARLAS
jgi:hypothetical protein